MSAKPEVAPQQPASQSGFSLVELVVTMSLLALVLGSLSLALVGAQRTEHYSSDRAAILDATRASMARMTKDIRQASWIDPASTGAHMVMASYVEGVSKTITYDISGSVLLRTVSGKPSEQLQTNLASTSIFSYSPDVANSEIVTILIAVEPPASPDTIVHLTSEVRLRNRQVTS